jgi:hypothetical protein
MNVYADNNFLIYCAKSNEWREEILSAIHRGTIRIVLSPWSIREIGNNTTSQMEELIEVAERFTPTWILERMDLQIVEAITAWKQFWLQQPTLFNPFGTLAEVHGKMFSRDPRELKRYTLRDYARQHQSKDGNDRDSKQDVFDQVFSRNEQIFQINRDRYKQGQLRSIGSVHMGRVYMARIFACSKLKEGKSEEIHGETDRILDTPHLFRQLSIFAESGRMHLMRAYRVESLLTEKHWDGDAHSRLKSNTQIDRQHATTALAYCDALITNDKQLITKTEAIRSKLRFPIAAVMTGETFIEQLRQEGGCAAHSS